MNATPRMDALLSPSRQTGDAVRLQDYSRGEGGRIMSLGPTVNPNEVAIELFREMGHSLRRVDEKLDLARQELAEVRGAEIPEALRDMKAEQLKLADRIGKVEEAQRTAAAVARPWLSAIKELGKALLPIAMTALLLLLGLKELKP